MNKGQKHSLETRNRLSEIARRRVHVSKKCKLHPEKKSYCRGLCRSCYNRESDIAAKNMVWRGSKKRLEWEKQYDKSPARGVIFRRHRHAFDVQDEARFASATRCDWCGFDFRGETPRIDHDRSCCDTSRHCRGCTRGFVHHKCNIQAIAYYEWIEKRFGKTDSILYEYRNKFPVPRLSRCA